MVKENYDLIMRETPKPGIGGTDFDKLDFQEMVTLDLKNCLEPVPYAYLRRPENLDRWYEEVKLIREDVIAQRCKNKVTMSMVRYHEWNAKASRFEAAIREKLSFLKSEIKTRNAKLHANKFQQSTKPTIYPTEMSEMKKQLYRTRQLCFEMAKRLLTESPTQTYANREWFLEEGRKILGEEAFDRMTEQVLTEFWEVEKQ